MRAQYQTCRGIRFKYSATWSPSSSAVWQIPPRPLKWFLQASFDIAQWCHQPFTIHALFFLPFSPFLLFIFPSKVIQVKNCNHEIVPGFRFCIKFVCSCLCSREIFTCHYHATYVHSCKCLCVCVFAFVSLFVCIVLFVYVPLYLLNCVCVPLFTGDFHLVQSRNMQSWRGQRVRYASTGFAISNLNVYN